MTLRLSKAYRMRTKTGHLAALSAQTSTALNPANPMQPIHSTHLIASLQSGSRARGSFQRNSGPAAVSAPIPAQQAGLT